MSDVRVSSYVLEQLGYKGVTFTLPQMIVGAILTELDGRRGFDLGLIDDDILVDDLGPALEECARKTMAGDGVVK